MEFLDNLFNKGKLPNVEVVARVDNSVWVGLVISLVLIILFFFIVKSKLARA